jgi:hypothetical protein
LQTWHKDPDKDDDGEWWVDEEMLLDYGEHLALAVNIRPIRLVLAKVKTQYSSVDIA